MKSSTVLGAMAALCLGSVVAQITVTIPGLPDLPTISMPTLSIPNTISIPSLPTIPASCLPSIPNIQWPTLEAPIPTSNPDSKENSVQDEFKRTHPRQLAPVGA
ncbi:hypothetical protein BDW62DRAFT_203761 [Aspergillus aurantiobrunneus]